MHDGDTILAQAPLRIRAAYGRTVRYRELYRAILDGEIEADRVGRNWVLTKEQLARAAEHFGLTTRPPEEPQPRRRRAA